MLRHVNVGKDLGCTIKEMVETVANVVGFSREIVFDTSKADAALRKLMNVNRLKSIGWQYSVELEQGLTRSYQWFIDNQDNLRT